MPGKGMALLNLQLARFNLGWSQEKLADKSGVSRSAISELEQGNTQAKSNTAKRLADALGVKVWQIQSAEGSDLDGQSTGSADTGDSTD